jgi:hypothetical protein
MWKNAYIYVLFQQGESTNSRVLQCANEANVVTEDDIVNDGIDDETASDAEMDEDAEANGDESSDTDEDASVSWIEQQPLPYPSVSTQIPTCGFAQSSSDNCVMGNVGCPRAIHQQGDGGTALGSSSEHSRREAQWHDWWQ